MHYKNVFSRWKLIVFLIFSLFFLCALWANLDLIDGRFALFMDERITFDGIKSILHPEGIKDFILAVVHGNDHRYGRILWYTQAAFSYLPERLFGDSGQIVAGRVWQTLLIMASCCIWIFGIIRTQWLRIVFALTLLSVPYTSYYMTMPKPEPLQIFFLSCFCYYCIHKEDTFGWYWIFAGLAFGTKIASLPALFVFALGATLLSRRGANPAQSSQLRGAIFTFFLGLVIAVPILIPPFALALLSITIYSMIIARANLKPYWNCLIITVLTGSILLFTKRLLFIWVRSTFLNTAHGADQASVNALSWLRFFFEKWLAGPVILNITFVGLLTLYCLPNIFRLTRGEVDRSSFFALTTIAAGVGINAAIFISAKRLWGFYLYPGTFLALAGVVLLIDVNLQNNIESHGISARFNKIKNNFIAFIIVCFSFCIWLPNSIKDYYFFSQRTNGKQYASQYESYKIYTNFLEQYSAIRKKNLQVAFTPSLFPPKNSCNYTIVEFWGPYMQWDNQPDVIIFGKIDTPRGDETPKGSPEYNKFIAERAGYARHVTEQGGQCAATPCFERVTQLPNEGEILVLQN